MINIQQLIKLFHFDFWQ